MKLLTNLNLLKNELQNAKVHVLSSAPSSPGEGQIYYDSVTKHFYIYNGTGWIDLVDALTLNGQVASYYLNRANQTGSINESDVTNLTTDLAAKAPLASPALTGTPTAPTASVGTNTTQLATTAFVAAAVSAAVTGVQTLKGGQDCSANPNYPAGAVGDMYYVTVAGKIGGASGISVDIGDTFVCKTAGIAGTQAGVGANWFILEHNLVGALLSANNLSDIGSASTARTNLGAMGRYSATIGDGAATSITVNQATHGLAANSQLSVIITDATTGEVVYPDITIAPASGNVTIAFATAPSTAAYRITIIG